jgi:cbb3-type cytochrome oxidase subunit 3
MYICLPGYIKTFIVFLIQMQTILYLYKVYRAAKQLEFESSQYRMASDHDVVFFSSKR